MIKRYLFPVIILLIAILGFNLLSQKDSDVRRSSDQTTQSKKTADSTPDSRQPQNSRQSGNTKTQEESQATATQSSQANPPSQKRSGGFGGRGGLFGQSNAATVSLMEVRKSDWAPELSLFGRIMSDQQRDIRAQHNTQVEEILVTPGMQVEESQPIMTLNNQELLITQRQTRSRIDDIDARIRLQALQQDSDIENLKIEEKLLSISQKTLNRYENLSSQQLSSSTDYETALKNYQNQLMQVQGRKAALNRYTDTMAQLGAQKSELLASLESINAQIDDTHIMAPFSGIIASIGVDEGQQVAVNTPLVTLYNPESMAVESRVPVKWLHLLLNQEQKISATSIINDLRYSLTLSEVDSVTNQGSILVKFQFDNAPLVALGQHIALTAVLPEINDVYAIPAKVLYEGQLVFIVENNRLQSVSVTSFGQLQNEGETWYLVKSEELEDSPLLLNTRLPNASTGLKVNIAKDNQGL